MQGDSNSTERPHESGAEAGSEAIVDQGEAARGDQDAAAAAKSPGDPLAEAQAEAAKLKDAWLRTAADYDNFRKRTRREIEDAKRNGRDDLLRAMLPVFDNLERAIQSAGRATDVKALADGLSMVQRQFVDALGREGIARVATVGLPFDPTVHEAIQQVETGEHAPGTVLAEVQPGYTQGDRLVRAAMVVVAKAKSEGGAEPGHPAAS
jgi:molecular chaperone GrpE